MAKRGRYTRENMTKDQLSALVNFVKCNAPIWDKSNKDYKNQELKDKLWSSLGVRLNKTVEQLKKRWKTMRDYEIRKIQARKINGVLHGYDDDRELGFLSKWHQSKSGRSKRFIASPPSSSTQQTLSIKQDPYDSYYQTGMDQVDQNEPNFSHNEPATNGGSFDQSFENSCSISDITLSSGQPLNKHTANRYKPSDDELLDASVEHRTDIYNNKTEKYKTRSLTQQYFDLIGGNVEELPSYLQNKCLREIQIAIMPILHKYQIVAEEDEDSVRKNMDASIRTIAK